MTKIDEKYIEEVISSIKDNNFLKKVNDNIMLRKNEIKILDNNNINYSLCKNLSEIIFQIEQKLNEEYNEELELLSLELSERNYYRDTRK